MIVNAVKLEKYKKRVLIMLPHFLLAVFIFSGVIFILGSIVSFYPFGHDESVYLTEARSWIEGTPADEFEIYRPIGMPALGWLLLQFNDSEKFVRFFGIIFGAITILFIYLFFKRLFNILVAIGITGIVASSHLFLKEAPLFQNDIPSAGFLIGVLWLIYIHYKTDGKSKSIYFVGPLAAFTFYIRYGVASSLGIIGILSFVILGPRFIKKKADYSILIKSFIVSVFLFAPHFIQSLLIEKKLLGILSRAGEAAHRKYLGEGLVNYIKLLPNELGGWIIGITAIIGILAVVVVILNKNLREEYVNLLWIGSIGIVNFITTGLLVHAEPRYVFFPLILLSATGIASLYYLTQNLSKILANSLMVVILLSVVYYGVNSYREANLFFRTKESDPYAMAYIKVAEAIHNDSLNGEGCVIWAITSNRPRISWYSECNTLKIMDVSKFDKDFRVHFRKLHYSVVRDGLKNEIQINQSEAERFGVSLIEIFRTKNLSKLYDGDLIVYRITKKDLEEEKDYLNLLEK